MAYTVQIGTAARKALQSLEGPIQQRVREAIRALAIDPRARGTKKLKGRPEHRVRVGDWRVVFLIDDASKLVTITRIAGRDHVYD